MNTRIAVTVLALGLSLAALGGGTEPMRAPLPPAEALKQFQPADDLKLEQVLTEPAVAQPVFLSFDERGRLWVVQYLQYPEPAGLTVLGKDRSLRAVYDQVPPPPPHHFKGRDRITIHEDSDGDGRFDRHRTFVEGLNVATSCARGRGGVWVLNPPYLLFYPDRNNDDVPDGDPVVHLEGFGLEDTHACANSLQWGPDGWLYAAQGSTVSAAVRPYRSEEPPVQSMGQLVWRYHPQTRRYEVFAEGGGNTFGLEFDSRGRLFSGHNGGDARGFHYLQGAYLQKGFAKHGPLSNPHAFGYFAPMKHGSAPRFSHTFVIYEGAALPRPYHGRMLAVEPLPGRLVMAELVPEGATFRTRDVGHPLRCTDPWFRPVDVKVGPDGAVYVADFYEAYIAHLNHHAGKIDRSNGRIYRLMAPSAPPLKPFDLGKSPTPDLVGLLRHPNKWHRRTALRLLGDRQDRAAIPLLRSMLETSVGQDALEALWGLNLLGGFDEALALRALDHKGPHVRLWAVRLLGDEKKVSPAAARKLVALARTEPNVEVRGQLACSAKRLPAGDALPVVRALLGRKEDINDPYIPLLLWWALEARCASDRDAVLALFEERAVWDLPMVRVHVLHRLMRRYAASGRRNDLLTCDRLLQLAPDAERGRLLRRGFEEAFQGGPAGDLPTELVERLAKLGGESLAFGLRRNSPEAVARALTVIADEAADADERLQYVRIFGEIRQPRCVPALLGIVERSADDLLRAAALTALRSYDDGRVPATVLRSYGEFPDELRGTALELLAERPAWAQLLLLSVDAGKIDPAAVPRDVVRRITAYRDERIARLVAKHWGRVEGATTAAMQQQIERLAGVVRGGPGSPYAGRKLYRTACARCHQLFGDGGQVGPDLTTFARADVVNLLLHTVNPGASVREGYEALLVTLKDGRVVSGVLADRDSRRMVLRGADGQAVSVRQEQVEEVVRQRASLMPEGLLDALTNQQVRDLFAYLRSTQPLSD